jgi:hypothetical protein
VPPEERTAIGLVRLDERSAGHPRFDLPDDQPPPVRVLSLDEIAAMVDDLAEAHGGAMPEGIRTREREPDAATILPTRSPTAGPTKSTAGSATRGS